MIGPQDRLHILMTADAVGGVWQCTVELSAALATRGHSITLALLGPAASDSQRADVAGLSNVELVDTGLPLDWLSEGPEPVRAAGEHIAALAAERGADLVHCNMPTLSAAGYDMPVIAVTHGCLSTWWRAAKAEPLAPQYRWHRSMMAEGLRAADAVVAPSASYAAAVQTEYDLPRRPLVVHNGRLPQTRLAPNAPHMAPAEILTIGRLWDEVKNAALLDRVAARINVPFIAAGAVEGPHGEIARLTHLRTTGQLSGRDIGALLAGRPIFVSAASFEPFGLAVLEAASAQCPLILPDLPTFRELWGGAAVFVPQGDADGFEQAIRTLLRDPAERFRMGQAAAHRAARYTPAAMAAAMVSIYGAAAAKAEAA